MALPVSPPPLNTAPLDKAGNFIASWQQLFTNWWTALRNPTNIVAPPANSGSTAVGNEIAKDANFLYVAVGKNSWKRIALQQF
jgi:hypothetical protein